ncbi:MAG: hypothetical protein JRI34_09090 [Deltaproteobacteria bacterium]|nr:hypothetical protein [Deltaproteobacteria bacterium]
MDEILVLPKKGFMPKDEVIVRLTRMGQATEKLQGTFERGTYCFSLSGENGEILLITPS